MELYTAIYESNDDELPRYLSVIDASAISLARGEAHIVGSLAARTRSLDYLNLKQCGINDELLSVISRCLKDRIHVSLVINKPTINDNFRIHSLLYTLSNYVFPSLKYREN